MQSNYQNDFDDDFIVDDITITSYLIFISFIMIGLNFIFV